MSDSPSTTALTVEERKLRIEESRLRLEDSFARKWLPTVATMMVGLIAAMFGYLQDRAALRENEQAREQAARADQLARDEAHLKDEREWGFKVIELYFERHELFDFTLNADAAARNLSVLAAVAPTAVQGVLDAEQARIPAPSDTNEDTRLQSLAAVANVQDTLSAVASVEASQPSAHVVAAEIRSKVEGVLPATAPVAAAPRTVIYSVYVQYPGGDRRTAAVTQRALNSLGFKVSGLGQVSDAPATLEVRYYLPEQEPMAKKLLAELTTKLGLAAGSGRAVLVNSDQKLPDGLLEVWLPAQ